MDILNDLYCRLCADLKPVSHLTKMVLNTEKCRDISNKLTRLDLHVNFNTILPKTVCFECMNSLESAFDFIKSVELAQEAFEDYDSSVFGIIDTKNEEVISHNDIMDTSDKYDLNIKTKDTKPGENDVGQELLIEYVPKNQVKEKKSKSTSKKRTTKSKTTTLGKISTCRQRQKPKISTNVDLDTWLDYNWLCAFCDKYFQSPSELNVHAMQYHDTCNPYRCFDCRARGLHMDNFTTHIARHRPVLALMCYKCCIKFETVKEMKAHKATHFDSEYICTGCNYAFETEEELDNHMKRFYKKAELNLSLGMANESLTCVICGKTLKTRVLLNRHLLIHTERKRIYVCDTCGDSFYNRKELFQHQIIHSDARPYKCEVCQFSFKIKHELRKHVQIHFGPKRFSCEKCDKCFRLHKELVVHSAVHKDEKPYRCSHCNKTFRFRHLLVLHLRIHTGLKPYACNDCQLTFRNWSNFNKHTKQVHGIDNSKRKRTSEGLYAVDPETKEVIYPDKQKVMEWKNKVLAGMKIGRPKGKKNSETDDISVPERNCQESVS